MYQLHHNLYAGPAASSRCRHSSPTQSRVHLRHHQNHSVSTTSPPVCCTSLQAPGRAISQAQSSCWRQKRWCMGSSIFAQETTLQAVPVLEALHISAELDISQHTKQVMVASKQANKQARGLVLLVWVESPSCSKTQCGGDFTKACQQPHWVLLHDGDFTHTRRTKPVHAHIQHHTSHMCKLAILLCGC